MAKLLLVILGITCGVFFAVLVAFHLHLSQQLSQTVTTLSESAKQKSPSPEPSFSPLTLDSIFSATHDLSIPDDKKITIIATGDIIPARVTNFMTVTKNDFIWPYVKTSDVLKNADLTFINLESPLIQDCPTTREGMVFCSDQRNIQGLVQSGIDVASLANNHAANHGPEGVSETVKLLSDHGITATGVNGPIYKEVKGVKFAFLGFNDITKPQPGIEDTDDEKIKNQIAEAKKNADVVIVTYHWGTEYQPQPDERQVFLGHLTIDDGADLVIGNHPHWYQPVELYKGKLITYAHGNFVFDQEWSERTKEGVVGRYTFYGKKLVDVHYLPVKIMDWGQPYFLEDSAKQAILDDMRNQSELLATSSAKL